MKKVLLYLVLMSMVGLLFGNAYTEYFKCPENSLPDPVSFQYSSDRPMDADHVIPENGGALGVDSFYHPTNHTIYVYGSMYLTLIDATDNSLIKSLQVTDRLCTDKYYLSLHKDYNLFAFDEVTNTLFCGVETGDIVAIDCNTNTIAYEITNPADSHTIPLQHRLLYDGVSQTLFQYYNNGTHNPGPYIARFSAYTITPEDPEPYSPKYSELLDGDDEEMYDLILHYDTSGTNVRWLLFSTITGDVKYINCFDNVFDEAHIFTAYSVLYNQKARGFCNSIVPTTNQPELLCGLYDTITSNMLHLLNIHYDVVTHQFQNPERIQVTLGPGVIFCKITYIEYNDGMLYIKGWDGDDFTRIVFLERNGFNYAGQYTFQLTDNRDYGRPIINSNNGDLLVNFLGNINIGSDIYILRLVNQVVIRIPCTVPGAIRNYIYGAVKYFTIDQTPSFLIPLWDSSLCIASPDIDSYSCEPIITGCDYSRFFLTDDGAYAISWYLNGVYNGNNPVFITNTTSGTSIIHNFTQNIETIGYNAESNLIYVPEGFIIKVYNIQTGEPAGTIDLPGNMTYKGAFYSSGFLYLTTPLNSLEVYEDQNWNEPIENDHLPMDADIVNFLDDKTAERVVVYANEVSETACNMLILSSTTGLVEDRISVPNPIWKIISDYNEGYYILCKDSGSSTSDTYSYICRDGVLELMDDLTDRLLDMEYSKTSKRLFKVYFDYWLDNCYLRVYDADGTLIEYYNLDGICTNLKMNQFTNRLYLYFPYKCPENEDPKIMIGVLDVDDTSYDIQFTDTTYGYNYSLSSANLFAWTEMQINPETGDVLFIPDRSSTLLTYQDDMDTRKLTGGSWRWVSFPQLNREDNDPVNGPDLFDPVTGIGMITQMDLENENENYYYLDQEWLPDEDFTVQSTEGIKIKFSEPNEVFLPVQGQILDCHNAVADFDLVANDTPYVRHENWIGYWLMDNQMPQDAFGDDWDKVVSIAAEDWYYINEIITPRDEVPASSKTHPLEYGESYVIKVKENISGFRWGVTGISLPSFDRKEVENFTYEDKSEYEVIDVMDIDENVIEIGVFDGDTCIGAVAVQDSCEQILVYPDSTSTGDPYEFQVVSGRSITPITNYQVFDENKMSYLYSNFGATESYAYHRIKLGELGESQSPEVFSLNGNYPNPFNPETKIVYSLPEQSEVKISVYNIKGQLVKVLCQETEEAGEHFMIWDGKDKLDNFCASGVYFCKIKADSQVKTQKMLLLK